MYHPKNILCTKRFCKRFVLKITLITAAGCIFSASQAIWAAAMVIPEKEPELIEFNPGFIHGAVVDVSRFSAGNFVAPGRHTVKLVVNNESHGQEQVIFYLFAGKTNSQPCFTLANLQRMGVIVKAIENNFSQAAKTEKNCARIEDIIPDSSVSYDSGDLQLSVSIPQIYMHRFPRGYIDPASWESGVPALFVDYNNNLYTLYTGSTNKQRTYSNNLNMTAGINAGGWRLRKRVNNWWSNREGMKTNSLFGYAQTDITPLKSQLTVGDSTTGGNVFDGITLRGIQLQSDERMLPEGIRHYTPILRGVADTNARVRVTQRGQTVYETTVPPGPFELTDIGAMGYGGDLLMTITETNGSERSQTIPFSAPPMLLHRGIAQFGFSAGQLRDDALRERPWLAQGIYQYGLTSMYTLYGGAQLAEHYRAFSLGNAINTAIGGVSVDGTHAQSELADGKNASGNSFRIGYSKFLEATNTDFTLAAYRYSTKDYYSFREASIAYGGSYYDGYEADYRTRQRLSLTLGQRLWQGAYVNASGSLYRYWDGRPSVKQYSLSYSQSARYFSWTLSAMRAQRSNARDLDSVALSVNVPLGTEKLNEKPAFSTLYSSLTRDNAGNTLLQTNVNGYQGEHNELVYGLGASAAHYRSGPGNRAVSGNASYRSPYGQLGITGSAGSASGQLSLSASGSVVAHQNGITAGPQLGDSAFAIVSVPGGKGGKLLNGYGSVIDGRGYAIMPSLTAYRKNSVMVDAKGLPETVDILENEAVVIPRAGSSLLVEMKTQAGAPAILTVKDGNGDYLPVGSELLDEQGVSQAIVGQRGQAFNRGWSSAGGILYVAGDKKTPCRAVVDDASAQAGGMVHLEVTCSQ